MTPWGKKEKKPQCVNVYLNVMLFNFINLFPFVKKLFRCNGAVGVNEAGLDPIALGNFLHLIVNSQNRLSFCIRLRQSGFELLMSCN